MKARKFRNIGLQLIFFLKFGMEWPHVYCMLLQMYPHINTLRAGLIQAFRNNSWFARGFAREFLHSCMLYRPGRSIKKRDQSSRLDSKKNFLHGGVGVVCEWRHKWRTFRPPWPTLPGPGRQPLGGSISLKFLLQTRLQSESFDTLGDLLGFQVQKLWCLLVKILD